MAFFKFRKSSPSPDASRASSEAAPPETVESLRRRALYRLIGAAVLVIAAIVGFPLLFDTQPRPVAVNAPIAIPDRDGAPPLTVSASGAVAQSMTPGTQATPAQSSALPQVPAASSLSAGEEVVTATGAGASAPVAPPPPSFAGNSATQTPRAAPPAGRPDRTRADQDARARQQAAADRREAEKRKAAQAQAQAQAQAKAQRQREQAADAARARALLEGQDAADLASNPASSGEPARHDAKPSAAPAHGASGRSEPAGGHYVIQIGAFADAQSTQSARQKAEHAGVAVYTQTVTTAAGQRTRVRAGPFASRDEADRALAKLKQAGLGGSILSP